MIKLLTLEPENLSYNRLVSLCKKIAGNVLICGDISNKLNSATTVNIMWDDFRLIGDIVIFADETLTFVPIKRKGYTLANNLITKIDGVSYYLITNEADYLTLNKEDKHATGYEDGIFKVQDGAVKFCADVESLPDVKYPDSCINLLRDIFNDNPNILISIGNNIIDVINKLTSSKLANVVIVLPDTTEGNVVHGFCERDGNLVFRHGKYSSSLPEHIAYEDIVCQSEEICQKHY